MSDTVHNTRRNCLVPGLLPTISPTKIVNLYQIVSISAASWYPERIVASPLRPTSGKYCQVIGDTYAFSLKGGSLDDDLLLDAASRRRWLLAKALEFAPLAEALAFAQAAEDFISGTAARTGDGVSSGVMTAPTFPAGPEAEATQLKLLGALPLGNNQPPPGKNDQPSRMGEALTGLSSLTSIDEVILYLRQSGEVFAEDENANELLGRANLKRMEQGLPPFALLPTPLTKATHQDKPEKVTRPRPPSARERAEWARRVVTSPAE
jgi:hypothetical protein